MRPQARPLTRLLGAAGALMLGACALPTATPLNDGLASAFFLPAAGARPAAYRVETRRDAAFTTSDGVRLVADVHRPLGLARTPTILVRIPFNDSFGDRLRSDAVGRFWAARGYTVVVQGTRGRYRSSGDFYPAVHERHDGLETLAWLREQPWYDGRVAMWGGSAFGHTQWAISDQDLDALFIQIASTDYFDVFHPGGAFALESALYWALVSQPEGDRKTNAEEIARGADGLPVVGADDRALRDTGFFNDWALNRERNAYWERIDGVDRAARACAPVLLLGGWYDPYLPTMLDDFAALSARPGDLGASTRIIIGPFAHARTIDWPGGEIDEPYRQASVAPALPWFDAMLGAGDAPLDMARVRLFVLGENVWRDEEEWPLARTAFTPFYLRSDGDAGRPDGLGALSLDAPSAREPADRYVYDPSDPVPTRGGAMLGPRSGVMAQNEIEARADVLVYDSPVLETPLEVTGPVRAVLHVLTDAPSTDFMVKLVDVRPDGTAYNISDGVRRMAFAPGAATEVDVALQPTSMLFGAGHRIRIEVSSSNYPLYDRNPNTGESPETATEASVARQAVLHTPEHPSRVILPVIPR